jgi:hypothetical protein
MLSYKHESCWKIGPFSKRQVLCLFTQPLTVEAKWSCGFDGGVFVRGF